MKLNSIELVLICAALLPACKDKMCAPGEAPAAFAELKDVFPSNAVVCDPNWTPDGSKPAPQPRGVHLYFKDKTPHEAWLQTVDDLEKKDWKRTEQSKETGDANNPPRVTFTDAKGNQLDVLINRTDNGTHAHFGLK